MNRNVKTLAVVGAGTAGLIAALILKKRFPEFQIDVIHSKNIGIIGVGEGSTEHFKDFMNFIGINLYELIKECDASIKIGVMFENWTDTPYMHSVQSPFAKKYGQYSYVYARQIANNLDSTEISSKVFWENKINLWFLNRKEEWVSNQFHFNTHKLNEFLTKISENMGINFIDDEIEDVTLDDQGYINSIIGEKQKYSHDFYIDSTGFKRILMNKLGAKWKSFGNHLKMKAAIAFPTEEEPNMNAWTLSRAMDYGWLFRIPVWGRYGNGYIFDSDYISTEQAKLEVEKLYGREITIGKEFRFDPGALENVWIKNCVAIGLSGSFFEPMEASSIGTSIQQAFLLMHKIVNYNEKSIENYNYSINDITHNIRDFIALHYVTKKTNTNFWKDVSNIELPYSLKSKLDYWRHHLPIREDFKDGSNYRLFYEDNFTTVLHGLSLFNVDSIRKEYESLPETYKNDANIVIENEKLFVNSIQKIDHKEFIRLVREINY